MPLTKAEEEYLRELVDDLKVAHEGTLDLLRDMRTEREMLMKVLNIASLYIDARNGLNEIDPADLLTHLDRSILTFHQFNGSHRCAPTT
jgi:hypothetical protein